MSVLFVKDPDARTYTCADLKAGECKWPIGSPDSSGDWSHARFCCEPNEAVGAPYCLTHANIAYGRPE